MGHAPASRGGDAAKGEQMPYRTDHGRCWHERLGCHGAARACGTEGLSPCRSCVGRGGSSAGISSGPVASGGGAVAQGDGRRDEFAAVPAMSLPAGAKKVSEALSEAGFPCHAVGGCVRDAALGLPPHDWDMTTSATVEEMHKAFGTAGLRVYDTGAEHGTVTAVASDGEAYEVTTYRVDGAYSDGRHPDSVEFTDDIEADLARRDLTVNAMAWSPGGGLVDPFDGMSDIRDRTIRCVGDPVDRLSEDALRIMRVVRFAARLGFSVDPATSDAVHALRGRLADVAWERKCKELTTLLSTPDADSVASVLREYSDVIFEVVPELAACAETPQRHPWHRFDNVWDHTVEVVANTPADPVTRLAALLHDSGKPECLMVWGEDGRTSFRGHPAVSARLARQALDRLHLDAKTRDAVVLLVAQHDREVPATPLGVRRAFVRLRSKEMFDRWLSLRRADVMGQSEYAQEQELPHLDAVEAMAGRLAEEEAMFSPSDMRLRGADLIELGMRPGPAMGELLRDAFRQVVDGELPNDRDALVRFARERLSSAT